MRLLVNASNACRVIDHAGGQVKNQSQAKTVRNDAAMLDAHPPLPVFAVGQIAQKLPQ